jgi:acyl dehydratase
MNGTATYAVGDALPEWVMAEVSAERMRTMAALLRDPNPLHWDRDAVAALPLGLGHRTINQGPLGLGYLVNMLHAWAGAGCIRRITMRFPQVVLDGERVVARGTIAALCEERGERIAQCDIRLEHAERGILLEGTASVALS